MYEESIKTGTLKTTKSYKNLYLQKGCIYDVCLLDAITDLNNVKNHKMKL